jgi:hypothetical protein
MKTKTFKTKLAAMLLMALVLSFPVYAQVTIGAGEEPDPSAVLDLRSNDHLGLLLPRLALTSTSDAAVLQGNAHVKGIFIYNTNTANDVTPGIYYNDGSKWVRMASAKSDWFYMPASVLPTTTTSPEYNSGTSEFVYDIYAAYSRQFGMTDSNSSARSESATLLTYNANQLVYLVTWYDNTVFQNVSVTTDGKLHYKVIAGVTPTAATFMNIVFKVK